jgi:hypothetical protein
VLPPPPAEPGAATPARRGEAAPTRGGEVAPAKEVKLLRCKVALQPVAVVRAPALNADEATWSANLFHKAFMKL